ncbi:MAG: sugar phosphate isomerase/epimerase family protein [Ardenticatenaceae bacterium]
MMDNVISFMSANYVARQLGYNMTRGWGEGEKATSEYFQPIETFPARFEELLQDVREMDFGAIDLWTAHLDPNWASNAHLSVARDLLAQYDLPVVSLAGWFGSTGEEFEAACRLAVTLGCPLLGGSTSMLAKDRPFVVAALKQYDLKLGLENHPEREPEEMLEKIGDGGEGTIGTTVDTGWFGTQGYDAAKAIEALGETIFHVHLKDVLAARTHDTCRYSRGIVPIKECVEALNEIGYKGAISVEHEPEQYDPTEDCHANLRMLREWLGQD